MNVIALVEKACFRPVVGPQLFNGRIDVIDRIAGNVMAVRYAADEPVALNRSAP